MPLPASHGMDGAGVSGEPVPLNGLLLPRMSEPSCVSGRWVAEALYLIGPLAVAPVTA